MKKPGIIVELENKHNVMAKFECGCLNFEKNEYSDSWTLPVRLNPIETPHYRIVAHPKLNFVFVYTNFRMLTEDEWDRESIFFKKSKDEGVKQI